MRRSLHLFLLFTLFFNSTASSAFVGSLFSSGRKNNYLASRKQFSPCELNFVKLLNGKLPAEVFGASKTNLWSDDFSARNYLDELMGSEEFVNGGARTQFLDDLSKFVHNDEIYVKNIADLATLMRNEGLISMADLRKVFTGKSFPQARFAYSHAEKRLLGSVEIDPAKVKIVDEIISNSNLGKNYKSEYSQILRSSSLGPEDLEIAVRNGMDLRQDQKSLAIFRQYIEFLENYAGKKLAKGKIRSAMKNIEKIYDDFDPRWYEVDRWFKPHKKFLANTPENMNREAAIQALVSDAHISPKMRREYQELIRKSGLTQEQIEFAHKNGVVLREDRRSFERFKEYMVYLDYLPGYRVKKGLQNIEKIYAYGDDVKFYIPNGMLAPHKQFIAQRSKILKYENKRLDSIKRDFKMEEKDRILKEIDEIVEAKARGEVVDESRVTALRKEVDEIKLSAALEKRAAAQAKGEAGIFRKLMNGCNGGGSARLASATKKFKNFKLALAIGGTPIFYLTKNWDKKDEDQYFWERLGQEMAMGLFFTVVANKIVTNTNKGFWARYLEGYVKFGALDILSSGSYDLLFGSKGYARYFQQIYNGGELTQTDAEREFEKLKNSPTFEEDVEELMAYLQDMSEKKNFKNLLDKHFNLGTYSSLDEDFKITQEDLESEEAREVMLELLAEKMYLMNMGEWPIFQTGNPGADRWTFYRTRNILMDMKGMALSIAMFEIMCREPLGKVGSWGLVLALQMGDWMYSNKLTYNLRREAINQ